MTLRTFTHTCTYKKVQQFLGLHNGQSFQRTLGARVQAEQQLAQTVAGKCCGE